MLAHVILTFFLLYFLTATMAAISSTDNKENSIALKATVKLEQDMNIVEIRSLVERSMQKKTANEYASTYYYFFFSFS